MRFVKGFEYIVVLIAAIIFLFIIIFITIRQVKKTPAILCDTNPRWPWRENYTPRPTT